MIAICILNKYALYELKFCFEKKQSFEPFGTVAHNCHGKLKFSRQNKEATAK